jgi:hypothetical protein
METCKKPPYWLLHGLDDKPSIFVGRGIAVPCLLEDNGDRVVKIML